MSELVVVGFNDRYRASRVWHYLRRSNDRWTDELDDGVAVTCDERGRLRVEQCIDPLAENADTWASLWASLLGAALMNPYANASGSAARALALPASMPTEEEAPYGIIDARWWKEALGVPSDFIRDVGAMIQPGKSTIFLLLRNANPLLLIDQVRRQGGVFLHITLTSNQDTTVQEALHFRDAS